MQMAILDFFLRSSFVLYGGALAALLRLMLACQDAVLYIVQLICSVVRSPVSLVQVLNQGVLKARLHARCHCYSIVRLF